MIIVHVRHRTLNLFFSWRSFQDDDIECAKICDAGVGRVVFLIFLLKRIGFLCRHGDENIVGCDVDNDDNGDYNYEEDKRGTQPL